jgi:hypothetical protein
MVIGELRAGVQSLSETGREFREVVNDLAATVRGHGERLSDLEPHVEKLREHHIAEAAVVKYKKLLYGTIGAGAGTIASAAGPLVWKSMIIPMIR